ncbi:MAG TPA: TonB-dependent receptor, partial [Steroidobacteraceae bacterium]|nr:TonB-dependent receptor [Steroidobacteraceae bacterium]
SNFTDISNIPTTMIDRIEVLSGSDSAVYGSDAIAGVVNFILKKHADGTTLDFRDGETQHGGGSSQRLTLTSGYSNERFEGIFAVQLLNQQPLWAFQRPFTATRLASPADPSDINASTNFLRTDGYGDYLDPGAATCANLRHLDNGTLQYTSRAGYAADGGPGYYCGSYADVGYGTLENGRRALDFYGSGSYRVNEHVNLFLDLQAGFAHQVSYYIPGQWSNSYALNGGSVDTPFYNQATGQVEQWTRHYFTLDETGGLEDGEIHNINHTLSLNAGVKGAFGTGNAWNYEAYFEHAQNKLEFREPEVLAAKAQALYLGPSLGVDPDSGYNIYDAPLSRLYTPLTVAQFRSISQDSTDNDRTRTDSFNVNITTAELARLPAGPLGFAAVAEYGHESLTMDVDPLSLDGSYYDYHNTRATGSRDRYGVGMEFNIPVISTVTATAATRLDSYKYGSTTSGKVTYNAGLEYRPIRSLLLRGTYSTGFRAPDLSYLYAGPSGSSSDGTDYYLCRTLEPSSGPDYYDNCTYGDVSYDGRSHGSTALKDETSTSFTYGLVFTPIPSLQLSVDYYRITLKNEVLYQSSDEILRKEADCRIGETTSGQPVNTSSAACQAAISQVVRNPSTDPYNPLGVTSVLVLPINAAEDRTSGIDVKAHYQLAAGRAGTFDFDFGLTNVLTHTIQEYPGDAVDDELTDLYYWVIPRYKANASIGWTFGPVTTTVYGSRLGGLPNYEGTERLGPTSLFNASLTYRITTDAVLTLTCDNLFDTKPQRDSTYTSYPYYSSSWFSPVGRAFFAQFSYHFDWPPH